MTEGFVNLKLHSASHKSSLSLESLQPPHHRPLTEAVRFATTLSQAVDINTAINPLVAAAAPVILAVTTLKKARSLRDATQAYAPLLQEIKIFEDKARKLDYRSAIILAARYFLCAFADEAIELCQSDIRAPESLLQTLQGENYGGERFYLILERASSDPVAHIDLLELGFLCLSLGYHGKYHRAENPVHELENIKDNLLLLITKTRGNPPAPLLLKPAANRHCMTPARHTRRWPHGLIASAVFVVGALVVYLPYNKHLTELSRPVSHLVHSHTVVEM